jgi:hypothetical protein
MAALTHSPAKITRQVLIDLGHGFAGPAVEWSAFVGYFPDGAESANSTLALKTSAPILDGRVMSNGEVLEHHGVQILSRSISYEAGRSKMATIAASLDAQLNLSVTVSATPYTVHNFSRQSGILDIGREENGSRMWAYFTLNLALTIT